MSHNKLKTAIRARQAETGESYTAARAAVLAARGLPPDTPTSSTAKRAKEQRIRDEYGEHLGVPEAPPVEIGPASFGAAAPPAEIVTRRRGREQP
ncbi:MAG TPA: hypothetical protein PKA50_16445 [Gemmatimonadales bacterium]|nr:hypothetical protein [Gemmatimonadales bacterium]